jgi:orotidine-5'-phosphate decarboxylase
MNPAARDRLIIALDVDNPDLALELFDALRDVAGMFKVGSQLFTAAGPAIVKQIVAKGGRVFLDLKFHDIPNTVAAAAVQATRLGVSIFNMHASGGAEMMKRAYEAVQETAARENLTPPKVIAVTLLTSLDEKYLLDLGVKKEPKTFVAELAALAAECGLDGVVASPQEIKIIREKVSQPNFLIVTPGVRFTRDQTDDQKRTMTAADAVRDGADYLVVGRPILNAEDPAKAAEAIADEIESGSQTRIDLGNKLAANAFR